jgi:DNA modification methylase
MDKDRLVKLYLADQQRQDLKPSELAVIAKHLLQREEKNAEARRLANLKKGSRPAERETFPTRGRSLDRVGQSLGKSGKTIGKILEMAEAGFAGGMDAAGINRIDRAYRRFKRQQRADAAARETSDIPLTQVICADCREILPQYPDEMFHAAILDPPFGIGFEYDGEREPCDNPEDYWKWFGPIYQEVIRVTKPGGFICLWQAYTYLDYFRQWFDNWHPYFSCKVNAQLVTDYPYTPAVDILVMVWKPGAKPILPVKQDRSYNWFSSTIQYGDDLKGLHPCPRPLDLCEILVRNFTIDNGLILDCFAGSGQVPLAIKRVGGGRRCVAIEQNRRYAQVAEHRLRKFDETHAEIEAAGIDNS